MNAPMVSGFFTLRCDQLGCPCFLRIMVPGGVPVYAMWAALREAGLEGGWVMGTDLTGPHYCACDHSKEGSRDPR